VQREVLLEARDLMHRADLSETHPDSPVRITRSGLARYTTQGRLIRVEHSTGIEHSTSRHGDYLLTRYDDGSRLIGRRMVSSDRVSMVHVDDDVATFVYSDQTIQAKPLRCLTHEEHVIVSQFTTQVRDPILQPVGFNSPAGTRVYYQDGFTPYQSPALSYQPYQRPEFVQPGPIYQHGPAPQRFGNWHNQNRYGRLGRRSSRGMLNRNYLPAGYHQGGQPVFQE
jgi:hypothetical protein